jgi:hypothetical protein
LKTAWPPTNEKNAGEKKEAFPQGKRRNKLNKEREKDAELG